MTWPGLSLLDFLDARCQWPAAAVGSPIAKSWSPWRMAVTAANPRVNLAAGHALGGAIMMPVRVIVRDRDSLTGAARHNQLSHAINSKPLQRSFGRHSPQRRRSAARAQHGYLSKVCATSRPLISAHAGAKARPAARASTRALPRDMDGG